MEFNFDNDIKEYRKYMNETNIQDTYRRLSEYFKSLHDYFKREYNYGYNVSDIHENYIYSISFYFIPNFLKYKGLYINFEFNHSMTNFKIELKSRGLHRSRYYKEYFKTINQDKYTITNRGLSLSLKAMPIENPSFKNLNSLTHELDESLMIFLDDIRDMLTNSNYVPPTPHNSHNHKTNL